MTWTHAKKLSSTLGKEKVITDPNIVAIYAREPVGLEGRPLAVVFPETVEDVRRLVRYAYKNSIPIYPQGSSTSLSGSSVPEKGGIVLSMERMNRIKEISLVDSVVVVEPGVRLGELNTVLAGKGYMFPVDPASQAVATVGGAVNSGAGGMRGAKYGTMRDWVNSLSVVLPDEHGTLARIGCRTVKCRQGYDLTRLIVGSEGTLAIVVESILRIAPLPEAASVVLAFFDEPEGPFNALAALKERAIQPLIAEYMDARTVEWASRDLELGYEARGHMLVMAVDTSHEAIPRMEKILVDTVRSAGASRIYTASSLEEAEEKDLFRVRRNLFPAQSRSARELLGKPDVQVLIEDIVVPPSRLLDAVRGIRRLEEKYGFPTFLGGHIGDGNLHPSVGYDPSDESMTRLVHEWFKDVMKLALSLGGSISAEHGIGLLKKEGLRMEFQHLGSTKPLELMEQIKRAFDPKGILNPGKIV